jgi:hypothetical protein
VKNVLAFGPKLATNAGVIDPATSAPGAVPVTPRVVTDTLFAVTKPFRFSTKSTAVTCCPTVAVNGCGSRNVAKINGFVFTTCTKLLATPPVPVTKRLLPSFPKACALKLTFDAVPDVVTVHVKLALPPPNIVTGPAGFGPVSTGPTLPLDADNAATGDTPTAVACPTFVTVKTTVNTPLAKTDCGNADKAPFKTTGDCTTIGGDVSTLLVTPAAVFASVP